MSRRRSHQLTTYKSFTRYTRGGRRSGRGWVYAIAITLLVAPAVIFSRPEEPSSARTVKDASKPTSDVQIARELIRDDAPAAISTPSVAADTPIETPEVAPALPEAKIEAVVTGTTPASAPAPQGAIAKRKIAKRAADSQNASRVEDTDPPPIRRPF